METLTIDGPGRNALSTVMMEDLCRRIDACAGRPLLVRGSAGVFSAGLDLKEVARHDGPAMERYLGLLDTLIDRLFEYPGPMVTCIGGHAIAGGAVVALCGDLRIALDDPTVRIGLNEVALGLEFPPKILKLVQYRLPRHALERVVLEAGTYAPREALALGLIDAVAADVDGVAEAALGRLAAHPPETYAATKRTLRAGVLTLSAVDRAYVQSTVLPRWTTPELQARVRARLARKG